MFDDHLHTCFSGDSDASVESMVEAAVEKGLTSICVTDHQDPDFPPCDISFDLDTDRYLPVLSSFRRRYQNRIDLRIGVELGLQPHLASYFQDYVNRYPFDFIIGSTHVVAGLDVYDPAYFAGKQERDAYEQYFQTVLENLKSFCNIDVCGHLDYVVRYGPNKNRFYSYEAYAHCLDPILRFLTEKGIGLEVNTGGLKSGLGTTNPMPEIIKRYLALGGDCVTLGSDAHRPEEIAGHFPRTLEILKDCGVRYLCTFSRRRPAHVKL